MKTPINMKTLRKHLVYNSWKYILLVIITLVSWNLIFTMTAYRPPQEKIVDLYVYGSLDTTQLEVYWANLNKTDLPDMEQMQVVGVMDDATYGDMVLVARLAAGEGDIYLLPKEKFQSYANEGYLVALDEIPAVAEAMAAADLNLERGNSRLAATGERHTFGVPVAQLPKLSNMLLVTGGEYFVTIVSNNNNEENVEKALICMIRDLAGE